MNDVIKTFKQEAWHPQLDISIHKGAIVSIDRFPTNTPREGALAWIILRLNAQVLHFQSETETLRAENKKLKKFLDYEHKS